MYHLFKVLFISLSTCCFFCCQKKQQTLSGEYKLIVKANIANHSKVTLVYDSVSIDALVKGKQVVFQGTIKEPKAAYVKVSPIEQFSIFLDPSEMILTIKDDGSYTLVGSSTYATHKQYISYMSSLYDRAILLKRKVIQLGQEELKREAIEADSLRNVASITYAAKITDSYYSIVLLNDYYKLNSIHRVNENINKEAKRVFNQIPNYMIDSTELGMNLKQILSIK